MDMKRFFFAAVAALWGVAAAAEGWQPSQWPVLKHYDGDHLYRIALPLGGIGTGTVSLGGRGELRDWEIMNVPAKGYSTVTTGNDAPFFAIYAAPEGGEARTLLAAGPLYDHEILHYEGRPVNHHGLPRFGEASFDAAYPFGQAHLSGGGVPLKVTVRGFNPLVPCDADASSLPVAVLVYEVENTSGGDMDVAVCGCLRNFIGKDGSRFHTDWKGDYVPTGAADNRNEYRERDGLRGIYMYSDGVDKADPAWGTMALVTTSDGEVSYRTSTRPNDWNNSILDFWDDFSADGTLTERTAAVTEPDPTAALAVKRRIPAGESRRFVFFLTWNFPNRKAWSQQTVGNYYSTLYADAWAAAAEIVPRMPELERRTIAFVEALTGSSLPASVKEAALFNLSVLRSQTVFRLPSGHLMGWEGVMDRFGSCMGSCTHVWNYEMATPFLFGDLARTMRDVELNYATREDGLMNFRASRPLSTAADGSAAAADGQMGCVMKAYREWQLSGDDGFLRDNWPQVKRILSYAWAERGWDGNRDGVMEGSQHNTMDVNYFGPNPQMGFWYMGALRAAERMAEAVGEKDFARECRRLFERGSRWMDENLFNGEYYEHRITDPETFGFIDMDDPQAAVPPYQLGRGCLVDQMVGQYMAHICSLGYLADRGNVRSALQSVMRYNFVEDFGTRFNNMRSYVTAGESGLVMASWPKGRLAIPFPYFAESMTGFEYCAAVGMIYEGMEADALKCIDAIRARFDGARRNPFSEPECGHHYARSMASWGAVIALSDFSYSGVDRSMGITSRPGRYFWSNGYSWGTCEVSDAEVTVEVCEGSLDLATLRVGERTVRLRDFALREGERRTVRL